MWLIGTRRKSEKTSLLLEVSERGAARIVSDASNEELRQMVYSLSEIASTASRKSAATVEVSGQTASDLVEILNTAIKSRSKSKPGKEVTDRIKMWMHNVRGRYPELFGSIVKTIDVNPWDW